MDVDAVHSKVRKSLTAITNQVAQITTLLFVQNHNQSRIVRSHVVQNGLWLPNTIKRLRTVSCSCLKAVSHTQECCVDNNVRRNWRWPFWEQLKEKKKTWIHKYEKWIQYVFMWQYKREQVCNLLLMQFTHTAENLTNMFFSFCLTLNEAKVFPFQITGLAWGNKYN